VIKSIKLSPEYLAGLFDGEGSLRIWKDKARAKRTVTPIRYEVKAKITNTNKPLLDLIANQFPIHYFKEDHKNKRTCYDIEFSGGKSVSNFLSYFYNFLILKRDEAVLVLSMCSILKTYRKRVHPLGNKGFPPMTKEELENRELVYNEYCKIRDKRKGKTQ
jgi:hypothetical protein